MRWIGDSPKLTQLDSKRRREEEREKKNKEDAEVMKKSSSSSSLPGARNNTTFDMNVGNDYNVNDPGLLAAGNNVDNFDPNDPEAAER